MTDPTLRINGNPHLTPKKTIGKGVKLEAQDTTNNDPKEKVNIGTSGGFDLPKVDKNQAGAGENKKTEAKEKPDTPAIVVPKTNTSGAANAPGVLTIIEGDEASATLNRFEAAEAENFKEPSTTGEKVKKVAFGATVAAVSLVGLANATPAMAQTTQVNSVQQNRSQTPVRVSSVQDAVNQFSAENQLYVIGNPTNDGQPVNLESFQRALKDHPNVYVVINGNRTSDNAADEVTIGRGIGNSSEFLNVRDGVTGEQNGVVFHFSLNAPNHPKGRSVFMRSQGLPDQLRVGEDQWFPNGRPGSLGQIFVNNAVNEGLDLGGSMEEVFETINTTIARHASNVAGTAQTNVASAQTALDGIGPKVSAFQREHGSGGTLGSPDVQGWRSTLRQAQEALGNKDFGTASSLANQVVSNVRAHEQAMANYEQAPNIRSEVQSILNQVQGQLDGLPDNGDASRARTSYQQAVSALENFDVSYEAKNADFNEHLQTARSAANSASSSVQASKDAEATAKAVKLYGSIAVVVAVSATALIMNRIAAGKGKEAKAELEEATAEIAEKSTALLSLMEKADYNTMAGFTGETKKLADEVMDKTLTALTLVGGAEKFLAESRTLINGKGVGGKIKNMFLKGNYQKAIDLLKLDEGGVALKFDTNDSSRAVMEEGSKAADWRDQILKAGESRQFESTLRDVLMHMADNYDTAQKLHEEIEHKNAEITNYISQIDTDAKATRKEALALQEAGKDDGFFTAPAVTNHLLETVLADESEGGLLANGKKVGVNDPVKAWDDYGDPAKRMTEDAQEATALGKEARENLLPTIATADGKLHPHGVKTEWAHDKKEALSDQLNEIATRAVRTDVSDEISTLKTGVHTLGARVDTVVEQDHTRREVSPKEIAAAKKDVADTRQQVFDQLQAMGNFKKGTPDGILREPERDPSDRNADADQNLADIKPRLDVGDIEQAGTHIQNIKDLTQDAHRLAKETREAVNSHTETRNERQDRHTAITTSVKKTYAPSLARIKAGYVPKVMKQVAGDVGAGETLADNITSANQHLATAQNSTISAIKNFDNAQVLTARDELNDTDKSLVSAQSELDSVTAAEKLLGEKQAAVETELGSLRSRMSQTQTNAGQHFVRSRAIGLLGDAQKKLGQANGTVTHAVKSPYDADQQLSAAENLRVQTESAIEADRQAYNDAQNAINSASGDIVTATAAVASANNWSASEYVSGHGTVSHSGGTVYGASASLASAATTLARAESALNSKDYEEAERLAREASSDADSASLAAASAISSWEREFRNDVDDAEDAVERAEAAARAAAAADDDDDDWGGGGGSSGGWSGGGGSGGTSGGW